jgi:hypothetical protein
LTLPSALTKLCSNRIESPGVRLLTFLPDDSVAALRSALARGHVVTPCTDAASLVAAAGGDHMDAIVLDPAMADDTDWLRLRAVLASPRIPVLLYTRLSPENARWIVAAAALGAHEVMLRDQDDDAASLRARLERLRTPAPPARVMTRIADRLACLPPVLQGVTVPLFCSAPVPRWADAVAREAGVPRRSVDRWMGRAGLAGTATLLDVARLSRVWVPIVVDGTDPAVVAARGGFRRARMLAVHTRRIVGASPSHFGKKLSEDEFVDRLARHALRA